MFPKIRDSGLNAASRDRYKKELAYIKIHYDYEKIQRKSNELSARRRFLKNVKESHSDINGIKFDQLMTMDLNRLQKIIEVKKVNQRMDKAAVVIQRIFRGFLVRRTYIKLKYRQDKSATKLQKQWKVHRMRQFRDAIANHG